MLCGTIYWRHFRTVRHYRSFGKSSCAVGLLLRWSPSSCKEGACAQTQRLECSSPEHDVSQSTDHNIVFSENESRQQYTSFEYAVLMFSDNVCRTSSRSSLQMVTASSSIDPCLGRDGGLLSQPLVITAL